MFHVQIDGQTRGPYVLDQIRSMWASGILTADTVYREGGQATWKPVLELLSNKADSPLTPEKAAEDTLHPGTPETAATIDGWDSATPRPWRRLFARFIDIQVFSTLIAWVLGMLQVQRFHLYASFWGGLIFVGIASCEGICLAVFGTTLGKWLMGLRVEGPKNCRAPASIFQRRAFSTLWRCLPLTFLFCCPLAYRDLRRTGKTKWDKRFDCRVIYRRTGAIRPIVASLLVIAFICLFASIEYSLARMDTHYSYLPFARVDRVHVMTVNGHLVPQIGYRWANPSDPSRSVIPDNNDQRRTQ